MLVHLSLPRLLHRDESLLPWSLLHNVGTITLKIDRRLKTKTATNVNSRYEAHVTKSGVKNTTFSFFFKKKLYILYWNIAINNVVMV